MDIQSILAQAGGQEVVISGWDGGTVTVRLRRPSLVEMVVNDYIPNPLLSTVTKLFQANPQELEKVGETEQAQALHCIAARALVEPSMAQLQEAGVSLTDEQYMQVYAYVIGGTAALSTFRLLARGGAGKHDAGNACAAQQPAGN